MEFNHVYELYKKNLVRTGEAVTSRDLVARQYKEMSSLMDTMAENICSGFTFREDLEETLIAELDKVGIMAFEISVIESSHGKWRYISERLRVRKSGRLKTCLKALSKHLWAMNDERTYEICVTRKIYRRYCDKQISRDFSEVSGDSIDTFDEDYKQYVIFVGRQGGKRSA